MESYLADDGAKTNASYDFVCTNTIRSPFYNTWITINFIIGFLLPFLVISEKTAYLYFKYFLRVVLREQ